MAKAAKYYAVVLNTGASEIFTTWDAAQKFIATCPSRAQYKKCESKTAAEAYINNIKSMSVSSRNSADLLTEILERDVSPTHAIAFVDGSFNAGTSTWGYGVVIFPSTQQDATEELSGCGKIYSDQRNATGEVYGAMKAVQNAISRGFTKLTICHDHQGIAAWVTGAWDATTEMTQKYRNWMNSKKSSIEISFVDVAGHTGIEYNERADKLAKAGCGV